MAITTIKVKKDKGEKKKSKKTKTDAETTSTTEPATAATESESEAASPEKSRKRKRIVAPEDELEIDVEAPEPLSKKDLRRAKKGKTTSKTGTKPETDDEDEDAVADGSAATNAQKAAESEKSEYGIWIGNLPWTATKQSLREFLCEHASLSDSQITRVHMPAPDKASTASMRIKPANKGFAYVDFDSQAALDAAIEVSETLMSGRRVLIKNAKSFEGRPKKDPAEAEKDATTKLAVQASGGKEPSRKVFVGNLSFDVTKEDLTEHYKKCGEIADIHMATFQDSGKCKGYAWVTFEEIEAAASAVAGFVKIPVEKDDDSDEEMDDAAEDDAEDGEARKKKPKKEKLRKWFVNRLGGRQLRAEFAEDAQTRYKKRFGKEARADGGAGGDAANGEVFGEVSEDTGRAARPQRKQSAGKWEPRKVDARTIRPGAALANAPRASGAIVEAQGKKITFD